MKTETPEVFVQAGVEANPLAGAAFPHTLSGLPMASWSSPATVIFDVPTTAASGTNTHLIALHPGEPAPAPSWPFTISVDMPSGPFGMAETRVRGGVSHGLHVDKYVAVVGAFKGTNGIFGFIHGSIGKHTTANDRTLDPIVLQASLEPPSRQADAEGDYPLGSVTIVIEHRRRHSTASILAIAPGLAPADITGARIQTQAGNVIMDLSSEEWSDAGDVSNDLDTAVLMIEEMRLSRRQVKALLESGEVWTAFVIVTARHSDGAIVGHVTLLDGP